MAKIIFVIAFALVLIVAAPFVTIWAINTLFPIANIPFNFDTWVASLVLFGLTKTTITRSK